MAQNSSLTSDTPAGHAVAAFLAADPALAPYAGRLEHLQTLYYDEKRAIESDFGSLEDFVNSYTTWGPHIHVDGSFSYCEWAPGAQRVQIVGDFNNWTPAPEHDCVRDQFGVWRLRLDYSVAPKVGQCLKVRVTHANGSVQDHLPQWTFRTHQFPGNAYLDCILSSDAPYQWQHERPPAPATVRVYEAHAGISSEKPEIGSYRQFAETVIPHIADNGYNVLQLMAVQEHSYFASFGYQPTSLFAPASRCGTPDDLKFLIDTAHGYGIRVVFDIVLNHTSMNVVDGLNDWDGSDHMFCPGARGVHDVWNVRIFDPSKRETQRYLLSNLAYWLHEYNCDGFRFDAVTAMLYSHRGIAVGFTGNYQEYFGPASQLEDKSIMFLKLCNDVIHTIRPSALSVAEDVSGIPGLARSISTGGMGFDYRFNMAAADLWPEYLEKVADDAWQMGHIVYTMTNRRRDEKSIVYAECHDQCIVGSKTIAMWLFDREIYEGMSVLKNPSLVIDRGIALHKLIRLITLGLGGDGYLNFEGNEFGHPEWLDLPREGNGWSHAYARRQWTLTTCPHLRYHHLYNFDKALMRLDDDYSVLAGAEYTMVQDEFAKVIAFERGGLVFVINLHPNKPITDFAIPVSRPGKYALILDTDRLDLGGLDRIDAKTKAFSEVGKIDYTGCPWEQHIKVYAPPRVALVYALDDGNNDVKFPQEQEDEIDA